MRDSPTRRNLAPIIATAVLFIGAILIFAGLIVLFVGNPKLGGQGVSLYEITMGGGAVCMLFGTWLSRRWYKGLRSRSD